MNPFSALFGPRRINAGLDTPDRLYMENSDTHVKRGEDALQRGDLERAVLEFKYAVIANNVGAIASANQEEVMLGPPIALEHLRGPTLGPLNAKRTTKAQALLDDGMTCFQNGRYEKAVRLFTKAINLCPMSACPSFCFRAKCYLELSRYREAIDDLTIALKYAPNNIEAYVDRARAYEALGDTDAAQRDRDKALELSD